MAEPEAFMGSESTAQGSVSGLLNLDKPRGLTSHDVVARVRHYIGERRVGHAGTLDPLATGVLVLCIGQATRLVEYIMEGYKAYRATVRFGIETETWDAEGETVSEVDASHLSHVDLEALLPQFIGSIAQLPPMHSALKHEGRPLYRLARKGVSIERDARQVEIVSLAIQTWRHPDLTLDIVCSKGTYIRALAHDFGQVAGTGAYLADLTRTAVGPFRLDRATSLDALRQAAAQRRWQGLLLPVRDGLTHLPAVVVDEETIRRIRFGQAVRLAVESGERPCCAYDAERRLVAVMVATDEHGLWRPHKVLMSPI